MRPASRSVLLPEGGALEDHPTFPPDFERGWALDFLAFPGAVGGLERVGYEGQLLLESTAVRAEDAKVHVRRGPRRDQLVNDAYLVNGGFDVLVGETPRALR